VSAVIPLPSGCAIVEGDTWPLVPEGEYQVRLLHHETAVIFKSPKVYLHFAILEPGAHHGKHLFRAYRVKKLKGKPARNGSFTLGRGSDLFFTIAKLYPKEPRLDRISLLALRNVVLRASVRTVTHDYRQRDLPESMQYSVIDSLLSIEAGIAP
jgi:hypothetical protein